VKTQIIHRYTARPDGLLLHDSTVSRTDFPSQLGEWIAGELKLAVSTGRFLMMGERRDATREEIKLKECNLNRDACPFQ